MSIEKPYQPTPEETKKAEEMMTFTEEHGSLARAAREKAKEAWVKENINPEKFNDQDKGSLERLKAELWFSPDKEIPMYNVRIGGKTKEELMQELSSSNNEDYRTDEEIRQHFKSGGRYFWLPRYDRKGAITKRMLESKDFATSKEVKEIKLVRLSVGDLGFPKGATLSEIYQKAQGLGLYLCPAETGPHLRFQYPEEKEKEQERFGIAMKPIRPSDSANAWPEIFEIYTGSGGVFYGDVEGALTTLDAREKYDDGSPIKFNSSKEFVFSLHNPE